MNPVPTWKDMTQEQLKHAFNAIGLALNASHNTVATDRTDTEPTEFSWRIDHSQEIDLLAKLEVFFSNNSNDL